MTVEPAHSPGADSTSADPADDVGEALTMRELGKLTAMQVRRLDRPVPVTSSGLPIAWLVPLTASERRRAEMAASGRLRPARPDGLAGWSPLPPAEDGSTLSEQLLEMRQQERA